MNKYPDSPDAWNEPKNTVFREFNLHSTADIEILQELVEENILNRGNSAYCRARLLGILSSMYNEANHRFFAKNHHPKTWWIRYQSGRLKRTLHRLLKTKFFKHEVFLCEMSRDVVKATKK